MDKTINNSLALKLDPTVSNKLHMNDQNSVRILNEAEEIATPIIMVK